jgi:hypothetical protein
MATGVTNEKMDYDNRSGSATRTKTSDRVNLLPPRITPRRINRASVASVVGERDGVSAADEGGCKVTENDLEFRDQQTEAYGLELFFMTLGMVVAAVVVWLVVWLVA